MKGLKKISSISSRIFGILCLTAMSASARPVGRWTHHTGGKSIPVDSTAGIIILVSIGVFLLVIFLLVVRAVKNKRK